METLQRWVLLLCCGAVLYGVVENLLPRQGVFPVIKAVAILYIVSILLSPIQRVKSTVPEIPTLSQSAAVQSEEAQRMVLEKSAALLKAELSEILYAAGQDVQIEKLILSETDAAAHIFFVAGEQTDRSEAERLCNEWLGAKGNYEWKDG